MTVVAIVAYRPKAGKREELLQVTREHLPVLRGEGLATEMAETVVEAEDGTLVEVFEWVAGGADRAHTNLEVLKLWQRYGEVCDIVPLRQSAETTGLFAAFKRLHL